MGSKKNGQSGNKLPFNNFTKIDKTIYKKYMVFFGLSGKKKPGEEKGLDS